MSKENNTVKKLKFNDNGEVYLHKTEEGYYKGSARVTRTGILLYKNPDGSPLRILRHPDDVFKQESLATMKMIPVTDGHPIEKNPAVILLDANNAKEFSIGFTGEQIVPDGQYIVAPICVFDSKGINNIDSGIVELSCGYESTIEEVPGQYNGADYDVRQTNIVYNHVAILNKGRAGPNVRLEIMDGLYYEVANKNELLKVKEKTMGLSKVSLDGIDYEASPEVINALKKANETVETLKAEVTSTKVSLDSANKELATLKAVDVNKLVDEKVEARTELMEKARPFLDATELENVTSLSNDEIQKLVVAKKHPKLDLTGKSKEYVSAIFDSAILEGPVKKDDDEDNIDLEDDEKTPSANQQKAKVFSDRSDNQSGSVRTAEQARKDYHDRLLGKKK